MNLLSLIPLIIVAIPGIVQAVETAAAPGTSNADKKAAAMLAIEQAVTVACGVDPSDTALIQMCSKMASPVIDSIVAIYNLRGIFNHKSATAVAGK